MADLKDKNVLILGGLGFIGSNLAHRLVGLGANVTLVDSMLERYGGNLANIESITDRVNVNFSDIRDRHSLEYVVRDRDVIFCLAGQTSHIDSMHDPFTDMEINCRSQLAILECCRAQNPDVRIIYASTRQIYGRPQYLPVDEKHPIVPVDVNGINKQAAEAYYTLYAQIYGMSCLSLRLTNTYGPRQQLRGNHQGFVGIFIRMALSGEKIKIFGDGRQLRDFNYVDDVVQALLLGVERRDLTGCAYNLGDHRHYSLLDFVEILKRHCDFEHEIVPFPPEHKAIDIGDYYADYSLYKELTGWEPRIDLEEGMARTVEFFRPRMNLYWDVSG